MNTCKHVDGSPFQEHLHTPMTVILIALRSFCVSPFRYHRPAPPASQPASQPSDESLFQHFTTPPNGRYFTSRTDTTGEKEQQQQKKKREHGKGKPNIVQLLYFLVALLLCRRRRLDIFSRQQRGRRRRSYVPTTYTRCCW